MTPTLVDIARETKTSVSTVSRVLAGGDVAQRISLETRQRVVDAAGRLGYRPNLLARSLRTRKSYSIALLLPDISCGKYAKIAQLVETALRLQGYSLMLCNSGTDESLQREYLEMLPRKGLDGLIVVPRDSTGETLSELASSPIPKVILDQAIDAAPCVYTDFAGSATLLADALEQTGVEKILLVTGSQTSPRHKLRAQVLAARFEVVGRWEVPQAQTLKRASGNGEARCDAVVCTGSHLAESYLSSCRKIDLNRPVACFDASSALMSMPLPVMTCDRDVDAAAEGVLQLLLPQLRGNAPDSSPVIVPTSVKTNHVFAVG